MTDYEIAKQIVLSTGHMPQWMAEAMNESDCGEFDCDSRLEGVSYDSLRFGFRIYAGNPDGDRPIEEFPKELQPVIELARKLDCLWVVFDQDGPTHEELKLYDW